MTQAVRPLDPDIVQPGATLPPDDVYMFNEGRLLQAYRLLGAHQVHDGMRFAVWAPDAAEVSVVANFNGWTASVDPLHPVGYSGIWVACVPEARAGCRYKYAIVPRRGGAPRLKADPCSQAFELPPRTASLALPESEHVWRDGEWLERRRRADWLHEPMNVYEVHAGSWKRHWDGRFYSYRELAEQLVPYVKDMGFTHIELMPVMEHPFAGSWGYQTTGYFAPTRRYGTPDDLRTLIDQCHQAGLGVILDWLPAHFARDDFALAWFDGSALFEHADPRQGTHAEWGTQVFNYGRREVRSFLLSSAHYWLEEFHADGLRVDAVAAMLYLDYSRQPGAWLPNPAGGRENLDAVSFLQELNVMVHGRFPGAVTMAEESTAWPMVSRPAHLGGLGFSMKWNMGWMNDTLDYVRRDPVHRRHHHGRLTFSGVYAHNENFLLPLSHDEVVHGKGSLLNKMPGDLWRQFANLRLLFTYQMTWPGKKLNFMGNELGQRSEWQHDGELEWGLLRYPEHYGMQQLLRDLNEIYSRTRALHALDFDPAGFEWIDCNDADQSVISYLRFGDDGSFVVVTLNFTPVPRHGYCLGVPLAGRYREIFNSDSRHYGGGDLGNGGVATAISTPCMGRPAQLSLTLPPLSGLILRHDP
jgi:1,4-alpha-glucan branching enzyme